MVNTDAKRPGAYAVSSETKGGPAFFSVVIPNGVQPGSTFVVAAGDRRRVTARCPPTCKAGDTVQIAVTPEPEMHHVALKMAPLTTTETEASGGAKPMSEEVRKANQEYLEETADSYIVEVPDGVQGGQQFIAQTPSGDRLLVTCPDHISSGQKLRIPVPPQDLEDSDGVKIFQIKAPKNAKPGQVLPVLICGKRVPITLPNNVVPGQILRLKLPVEMIAESIELSYDDQGSKGWCRTVRLSDLKFQWVHQDDEDSSSEYSLKRVAFCRKLTFLEGNDPRMRTGTMELLPANEVFSESTLRHHHRTIVSYATVADIQSKNLEAKINWFHEICNKLTIPWESGRIKLVVQRNRLLADSVNGIMSLSRADMRKKWRIEFYGEPAIDSGGVTREFFELVSSQLFNPDFGLFLPSVNNQACMQINPASDISCPEDHLIYFRFLGRLMGRAMFDQQLIGGHMVRHLYKHILGWPITFDDLKAQDEEYYQSLNQFTKMSGEEISSLFLDFTVAEDSLGVRRDIELVEGGKDMDVTSKSLPQYLEAILKYRTFERAKPQITELLLGFFDVVPEPALMVFDSNELELILCGLPTIDIDDWESNTIYGGNCTSEDAHVKWFWEVVRDDFDQETRARLLQFVTGTSGVPSRGFAVLQGNDGNIKKFAIHGVDRSTYSYPRAHTCFNRIDLPNYKSKQELLEKLQAAVTHSAVGFGIQ